MYQKLMGPTEIIVRVSHIVADCYTPWEKRMGRGGFEPDEDGPDPSHRFLRGLRLPGSESARRLRAASRDTRATHSYDGARWVVPQKVHRVWGLKKRPIPRFPYATDLGRLSASPGIGLADRKQIDQKGCQTCLQSPFLAAYSCSNGQEYN